MPNEVFIVLEQVLIILILLCIGFISIKIKLMPINLYEGVGRFVVRIALPPLVFNTIVNSSREQLFQSLPICVLSIAIIFLTFGVGFVIAKLSRLDRNHTGCMMSCTALGNVGYIGIPLIGSLFQEQGLLILSLYMIFDIAFNWTVGINFMNTGAKQPLKATLKKMITPLNVAFVLAVLCLLLDVRPTGIADTVISGIGGTTKYMSLIYLGALLTTVSFRGVHRQPHYYVYVLVKLLLYPVAVYFLLNMTGLFRNYEIVTIALILALPPMPTLSIFAEERNNDYKFVAQLTFLGTLISLVTIPVVTYIISL